MEIVDYTCDKLVLSAQDGSLLQIVYLFMCTSGLKYLLSLYPCDVVCFSIASTATCAKYVIQSASRVSFCPCFKRRYTCYFCT